MKRVFGFFSFAALTQLVLLLNQIVLLPVQLRVWGTVTTASWYAAIALATITTFADLGLRTAGHAELLRFVNDGDDAGGRYLQQIWGWIRLLVCATTLFLLGSLLLQALLHGEESRAVWKGVLTVAFAIETLLTIRIVFLDSLGQYNEAELTYFAFAVLRFGLALPALLLFKLQPQGLAWLFLITAFAGIILQARLCKTLSVLRLLDPLPGTLSLATVARARHTMAEPLSNWLRLSLPVLVIASISTPAAVTMYVALRAVFGASRTTIQQLARVASVEYLRRRTAGHADQGRALLTGFVQAANCFALAIGGLVIVDNLRLFGLLLKNSDRALFHMVVASFAFTCAFYSYQILVSVMFRVGNLAAVAYRQYAFVLYSAAFSVIAVLLKSLPVFLCLLVLSEMILAISIMVLRRDRTTTEYLVGRRGLAGSLGGLVMIVILWLVVQRQDGLLMNASLLNAWVKVAAFATYAAALGIFHSFLNIDLFAISGRASLMSMFTPGKSGE
jgi:hypothetical protein